MAKKPTMCHNQSSCGFTSHSTQNRSLQRRSQANPLAWYGKTKPNTAKAHIHQSKEMYYNTKQTPLECGPMPNMMAARDVPDIRFRLAGYPAIFCYPVPAKILPVTG